MYVLSGHIQLKSAIITIMTILACAWESITLTSHASQTYEHYVYEYLGTQGFHLDNNDPNGFLQILYDNLSKRLTPYV